jgi:hypothetical protein
VIHPRLGRIDLFYNDTVPAINTSTVAESILNPTHSISKNGDLGFVFKDSTVRTVSPTQRTISFTAREYAPLAALAFHPTLAFSPLTISVANGPYVPLQMKCLLHPIFRIHLTSIRPI